MKKLIFYFLFCFAKPLYSQNTKVIDTLDSNEFYHDSQVITLLTKFEKNTANCEDYINLRKKRIYYRMTLIDITSHTKRIASKYDCVNAYYDLALELELKNKSFKNPNKYILMLDHCERKDYLYFLEKSQQYFKLALYYFYGLYLKKDKKKAIELTKKEYLKMDKEISDKEALDLILEKKEYFNVNAAAQSL